MADFVTCIKNWLGPLPSVPDGHKYILTVGDRSSKWLEALPVKDMETSSCSSALLHHWNSHFDVPPVITTM
jgi:hypothetical protein